VYQTLRVKTLFTYFYINYLFQCPIKCEIYRVTGAMGAVRDSFPLVKEGYVFSPLPCGPRNTTSIRTIRRTHIITWPKVVSPHIYLSFDV
jgi:hypothetical protein